MFSEILWFKRFRGSYNKEILGCKFHWEGRENFISGKANHVNDICSIKSKYFLVPQISCADVVSFLNDIRGWEGDVETCRIRAVQWMLRIKTRFLHYIYLSCDPEFPVKTLNSESNQCPVHQAKVTFFFQETDKEQIWEANWWIFLLESY